MIRKPRRKLEGRNILGAPALEAFGYQDTRPRLKSLTFAQANFLRKLDAQRILAVCTDRALAGRSLDSLSSKECNKLLRQLIAEKEDREKESEDQIARADREVEEIFEASGCAALE